MSSQSRLSNTAPNYPSSLDDKIPSTGEYFSQQATYPENDDIIAETETDLNMSLSALLPYKEMNSVHHPDFLKEARAGTPSKKDEQEFLEELDEKYGLTDQLENGEYMWVGPGMGGIDFAFDSLENVEGHRNVKGVEIQFEEPYLLHQDPELSDSLRLIEDQNKHVLQARNPARGEEDWYNITYIDLEFGEEGVPQEEMLHELNNGVARRERNGDLLWGIDAELENEPEYTLEDITDTPLGTAKQFQKPAETSRGSIQFTENFIPLEEFEDVENKYQTPAGKMTKIGRDMFFPIP